MAASTFGWLSYDDGERQRALEILAAIRSPGTIDELGVGTIRDTIARALFPGVSVLHARARYFTFIPALVAEAARSSTAATAREKFETLEGDLIYALLQADPLAQGIIGREAKRALKTKPSAMFWPALRRYGIVTVDRSIDQLLRTASAAHGRTDTTPEPDDDADGRAGVYGIAPEAAAGWLPPTWKKEGLTFALEPDEADYLRERIMTTTGDSLYWWFLRYRALPTDVPYAWDHPSVAEFPAPMRELLEHGRRFANLNALAALAYNAQVSEMADRSDLAALYRDQMDEADDEMRFSGILSDWSVDEFLHVLTLRHPRLNPLTQRFVRRWHALALEAPSAARSAAMDALIRDREFETKRSRARLHNAKARDGWDGGIGLGLLAYNWDVARRILNDILMAVPDASA